nr:hypothetical protein [Tanacetum cinerariifolium]
MDWQMNAPKDRMPTENTYSIEAVRALDTHRTTIQKQPEMLLCLVRISRRYYLGDKVYPTFLHDDDRDMDLFNLIRALNPTKVKIRSRPRAAHEVPLLTLTANRVVKMEEPAAATDSSGVPSTIERSPLDIANETGASDQGTMALEVPQPEDVQATSVPKAGQAEEVAATDPFAATKSHKRGHDGADVNAPLKILPSKSSQGTTVAGDLDSVNASFTSVVGYPESIYRPEWGVANGSMLDTPEACQNLVDHVAPPGYFSELRHLHNDDFLRQYNVNIARQVAMGSQPRLRTSDKKPGGIAEGRDRHEEGYERHEYGAKPRIRRYACPVLRPSGKQRASIPAVGWSSDAQRWMRSEMDALGCHRESPIGNGTRAAPCRDEIREFLELRQAFADVVSVGISKGMSEGLRHGVEHGQAQLSLESIETYDPEAEAKYVAALQASKDLKYPLVDQLEGLKDTPMDLTILVYLEVRDPRNPWAYKEEMLLADAIAANISRAEKKKKCRIVCRTHRVGSTHHARFDGIPVSVPTMVPQGLAILLADAATQMELEEAT